MNISCLKLYLICLYLFLLNGKRILDVSETQLLCLALAVNVCNCITHHHAVIQ